MKIMFYYILGELRDIFIPPFSLPILKNLDIEIQDFQYKPRLPKKVSYQPPKSVCKQTFPKGHRQR